MCSKKVSINLSVRAAFQDTPLPDALGAYRRNAAVMGSPLPSHAPATIFAASTANAGKQVLPVPLHLLWRQAALPYL